MEELVFIVPSLDSVIPLLAPRVNVLVEFKLPPLKMMLSVSTDPGVAPKLSLEDIEIVPDDRVVDPV